ncbi:MAG TPA: DUF3109 family protein [Candidatus Lokiarchaeia archaeon]|nr:DUF3109 family protein [Candidatus Lokiarchaeia archaeon]
MTSNDTRGNGSECSTTPPASLEMVKIDDFWVQKEILSMQYECDYHLCKGTCCSEGCSFEEPEKYRVEEHLPQIVDYLRDRPELPFWQDDAPDQWEFCVPYPNDDPRDEGWYYSKWMNGRCVLQITDGRCAVHAYCIDNEIPWETFKFATCTTWPIHFETILNPEGNAEWHIILHNEFYHPDWDVCPCIRPDNLPPDRQVNRRHIVEEMKNVFISRIGTERYQTLCDYVTRKKKSKNKRKSSS